METPYLEPAPDELAKHRRGHSFLDLAISFSALFMSGLSIFMAFHTSDSMERLVHANSWPFLQLEHGNYDNDRAVQRLVFGVRNAGTGVARVESFELLYDGRPASNPSVLFEACCADALALIHERSPDSELTFRNFTTSSVSRTYLPAGEERYAISWTVPEENVELWRALDRARQQGHISMRACYCSAFDECWSVDSERFRPAQTQVCAAPARDQAW